MLRDLCNPVDSSKRNACYVEKDTDIPEKMPSVRKSTTTYVLICAIQE